MKCSNSALRGAEIHVIVLALILFTAGLSLSVAQQVHGVAPSVTSQNFGGHINRPSGIPPSVTSLGNFAPQRGFRGRGGEPGRNHNRRGRGGFVYFGAPYYYDYSYVPYVDDLGPNDVVSEDYNPGPSTVFERRSPTRSEEYENDRASRDAEDQNQNRNNDRLPDREAAQTPETPAAPTVLVFKDGHRAEIQNYAIVGATLYDLGDGKRHKIDLADLNLPATAKENDDRGNDFEIPAGVQSN